jgi:hypothetical protein
MPPDDRVSNAEDYEVTAGRLCPFCGNADLRLIEAIRAGFACHVCSRLWAALPGKYRGDWKP